MPDSESRLCQRAWGLVEALVNSRTWPTLLVDANARILAANNAARVLLGKRLHWLVGPFGDIRHRDGATNADLQARIKLLGDDMAPKATRIALFVDDGDAQQTLVTLTRMENAASACSLSCSNGGNVVLITLNDGHRRQVQQGCQLLYDAFALTPAEARVAFALLDGISLQAYSDEAGIRISTVRWHMRNALAKTNCANQRDLVRLLISLIDS